MTDIIRRLTGFFRSTEELDRSVEERRTHEEADVIERKANSPFLFASWEAFVAYRKAHGYPAPRRRDSTWLDRMRGR